MIDQPSAPGLAPSGSGDPEIVLSDLRWPFAELGAQGVPPTLPVAKGPVQLTLSLLAALRNGVPTLVQYDDAGRVLATGDRVAQGPYVTPPVTSENFQINLAVGTESIELKVRNEDFVNVGVSVGVSGVDSGWIYYPSTQLTGRLTTIKVQVDHAQDSAVLLEVNNSSAAIEVPVLVTLVKAVDEVTILSNPGQEATVHLPGQYLTPVETVQSVPFNAGVAPGATLNLVAAIPNQRVLGWLLNLAFIGPTGADIVLQDAAGARATYTNGNFVRYEPHQLLGFRFGVNQAVGLKNVAGGSTPTVSGEFLYSTAA